MSPDVGSVYAVWNTVTAASDYLGGASLGITPGIVTPFGTLAINADVWLLGTIGGNSSLLSGFAGIGPPSGAPRRTAC